MNATIEAMTGTEFGLWIEALEEAKATDIPHLEMVEYLDGVRNPCAICSEWNDFFYGWLLGMDDWYIA